MGRFRPGSGAKPTIDSYLGLERSLDSTSERVQKTWGGTVFGVRWVWHAWRAKPLGGFVLGGSLDGLHSPLLRGRFLLSRPLGGVRKANKRSSKQILWGGQLYLMTLVILFLSPLPLLVSGVGSGLLFPQEIGRLGPIPARIRGGNIFSILILALSTAGGGSRPPDQAMGGFRPSDPPLHSGEFRTPLQTRKEAFGRQTL